MFKNVTILSVHFFASEFLQVTDWSTENNVRKNMKLSVSFIITTSNTRQPISRDLSVNNVKHGHPTFNWNTIIDAVFLQAS